MRSVEEAVRVRRWVRSVRRRRVREGGLGELGDGVEKTLLAFSLLSALVSAGVGVGMEGSLGMVVMGVGRCSSEDIAVI